MGEGLHSGGRPGPAFSVVIPTYQRAGAVTAAIRSCLASTFPDFEVVVVDDGSTDGTEAVVRAFADPRVRFVRQANSGPSVARNTGGLHARGRHVAFLDSDDEFAPDKLAAFAEAIAAEGASDDRTVWYSQLHFDRGPGNRLVKPRRGIEPEETVGDYLFAGEGMMQTSTLVVPRTLFEKVRFDPTVRNLEDYDLCLRLERAGARFRMLRRPLVVWYDHATDARVSHGSSAAYIEAWADRRRGLLSGRAYHGCIARYYVPASIRSRPIDAIGRLIVALRHGGVGPGRATTLLLRGVMPSTYARFRDGAVRLMRTT